MTRDNALNSVTVTGASVTVLMEARAVFEQAMQPRLFLAAVNIVNAPFSRWVPSDFVSEFS